MILSVDAKNAMLKGLADKLNVGTSSKLSLYIDTVLAAELTMVAPVQASIIGAVLTFKAPPQAIAVASGVPTALKITDDAGVLMATLDATEFTIDKDQIYMGGYVGVTTLTIGW